MEGVPDFIEAKEHYNEYDKIDPTKITAVDALVRANLCRLFPVIPNEGVTLCSSVGTQEPRKASNDVVIVMPGKQRRFRVTVEEIADE